jgi:hypothetical protein
MMPAAAAAAADLGAAELHGEDAGLLEADVADRDLLAGELLLRRGLDDRGTRLAAEKERGGVGLGVAADQQDALALFGHHAAEVGQRKRLADAALAVDRDDLGRLGRLADGDLRQRLGSLSAEAGVHCRDLELDGHVVAFQSRIILRQAGSAKAVA